MEYLDIFEKALNILQSKTELPTSGFLAGGSISNVVWNLLTENNAPVNDIDIYRLVGIEPYNFSSVKENQSYVQNIQSIAEDYSGPVFSWKMENYYYIENVSNSGLINFIDYKSNDSNPMIVLESFDINCCQLGYDLKEKKFYWTGEFIDFLKSKELKISNLSSPSHSAIRLVKKKNELNANLNTLEFDIISYVLNKQTSYGGKFIDTTKLRFKSRYKNLYMKYESELSNLFKLQRDSKIEEYLKYVKNDNSEIFFLIPKSDNIKETLTTNNYWYEINCKLSRDFIFWCRNIMEDKYKKVLWDKLNYLWDINIKNYLDIKPKSDDINLLSRIMMYSPNSVKNLRGKSISKQLELVKLLLYKFNNDHVVVISLLENINFNKKVNLDDEWEIFLMEMSVRKLITDENQIGKVNCIMTPPRMKYIDI